MGCTIDNLRENYQVWVLRDFVDFGGKKYRAGEYALIKRISVEWDRKEIMIEWEREGQSETLRFPLQNPDGPGSGTMQRYFEIGDSVDPGRPGKKFVPFYGYVPIEPEVSEDDAELREIAALARARRFEEAEQAVRRYASSSETRRDGNYAAAGVLCSLAASQAFDSDPTVYHWLRDRGIGLWYAWGSGATSGGEGAARAVEIRAAEAKFAALDRLARS